MDLTIRVVGTYGRTIEAIYNDQLYREDMNVPEQFPSHEILLAPPTEQHVGFAIRYGTPFRHFRIQIWTKDPHPAVDGAFLFGVDDRTNRAELGLDPQDDVELVWESPRRLRILQKFAGIERLLRFGITTDGSDKGQWQLISPPPVKVLTLRNQPDLL